MPDFGSVVDTGSAFLYTVSFDGTNYKALNSKTGLYDSINTDAWTVLNYAVNTGANANGAVFIKKGVYNLTQSLKPVSNSDIRGEGWQQTQLKANGNFPAITLDTDVVYVALHDLFLTTAQTGYTSNVLQFNNGANFNSISNVVFYDFGVASGHAIGMINTGAANSGIGIFNNVFFNISITGFAIAVYMQIVNASTSLPIDSFGNWINSNNFTTLNINDPTPKLLKCDGASGSAFHANNFFNVVYEATSCTDCAFDYNNTGAINPSSRYNLHSGITVWDIPGGGKYAKVNDSTSITFVGCIGDWNIGGTATTTQINTNLAHVNAASEYSNTDNTVMILNNKAVNATTLTNTGMTTLAPTSQGGFEQVLKLSIGSSVDYFSLENQYGVSALFSPIIRGSVTSANSTSAHTGLYFQGIIAAANDTGTIPVMIFGSMRTGQVALSTRPIVSFQNQFNDILTIFPTYADLHNNQLRNYIAGGVRYARTTITASTYTALDTDVIILADTTSNSITITLPAASGRDGKFYIVHRKAGTTNAITIDPNASETINGTPTLALGTAVNSNLWIFTDGTAWYAK